MPDQKTSFQNATLEPQTTGSPALAPSEIRVPFYRPSIGDDEIASVVQTLESGWLTTGPRVKQFETEFAQAVDATFAVAVNSATAGLHLALESLGIGPGDEVLVPTMTFAATAEVVIHLGAKPVLVDCEPNTLNIDTEDAARRVTPKTKAIMPVHYAGHPCNMNDVWALADERNLHIVEDAAHAFPASYEGAPIGSNRGITCFSFYANKTMTTGEGGMITTDNELLADRMRMMSLHGLSRGAWNRFGAPRAWNYDIESPGFKYNMPDISAAIGIEQLARSAELWQERWRCAERYDAHFANFPGITPLEVAPNVSHSWHLYVVRLESELLGMGRDRFLELLDELGVGTSVHYKPLHLHSYYQGELGYKPEDLPQATEAFRSIISLPVFPDLSNSEIDLVVKRIHQVVDGAK